MSNNTDILKQIPDCMEQIGENQFRCTKHGWVITTSTFPIRCSLCDTSSASMPSILERAKNFTKSAITIVKDKGRRVNIEEYKERLNTCNSNTCGLYQSGWCAGCGCYLPLKAWFASMDCPSGLW